MSDFVSKAELYRRCSIIRDELGIDCAYRIRNTEILLTSLFPRIKIEAVPFVTSSLHGICSVGTDGKPDVILLNSKRSDIEQNFDCMHEFVHLHEHRFKQGGSFCCYDKVTDKQDHFLEWQANEGAAELLVPYYDFIPRFLQHIAYKNNQFEYFDVYASLSDYYQVSEKVIDFRIDCLSYEIYQFQSGVPLERIEILSKRQRDMRGIVVPPYRAMCSFPLEWDSVIVG